MSSLQQQAAPSQASDTGLSEAELIARAMALVPLLRANAQRTERERRVEPDNLTRLRESGLLRLTTPRTRGGHGASIRTRWRWG